VLNRDIDLACALTHDHFMTTLKILNARG